MQELGHATVPLAFRQTYLASRSPFLFQVGGLVPKGSGEFFTREPWHVTETTAVDESWVRFRFLFWRFG